MGPILRSIGVLLLGVIVAIVIIHGSETLSERYFGFLNDVDKTNTEAVQKALADAPPGALWSVLLGYFIAAIAGGWLAARLSCLWPMAHAMSVAIVLLLASAINLREFSHPAWFVALNLLVIPLGSYIAGWLVTRSRPAPIEPAQRPSS